ncbi:MAG: chloride channel protein [Mucinivorans sp.]
MIQYFSDKARRLGERSYARLTLLARHLSERQLLFVLALIVGILAGVMGHILKESISAIQALLTDWNSIANVNFFYLIYPTIGITITVLFVKGLIKDEISHGVTRIFYAISRKDSRIKPHNMYSSVVGSSITIGFGGSVGAEAPIVLTGAAIGSNIGKFMRLKYNHITLLLGCGAAAAIAAVYKAPIAGFAFVLEVLMLELTFTSVVPLLISSVAAATTTYLLVGIDPFFGTYTPTFALSNLPFYAILGLAGGVVSYIFSTLTMKIEGYFNRIAKQWKKIAIGGLGLGALIFIFPPLYGEGYETIRTILGGDFGSIFNHSLFYNIQEHFLTITLYIGGILFFKVIAMTFTNAAGGVGGTFAPSLFVGAMLGFFFAITFNHFFGTTLPVGSFTLVGMAAIMSGVMKAPLTSMFLVAELTGGFQLFLPLMLTSAVSFALSYYFEPFSIYTKRLAVRGELLTHNKDENTMQFLEVDKLIERDFQTVESGGKLRSMIEAVENSNRNVFPVLRHGKLVGIITLDDIRADMFDIKKWDTKLLKNYMREPPERIIIGEGARQVVEKFETTQAWNLPVIDNKGQYVGFVSKSRLLTAYREQLQKLSID